MERSLLDQRGPHYLFTRKEVAQVTGFSTKSIIRAVERGLLREERFPSLSGTRSMPRYKRSAIEKFVAESFMAPKPRKPRY
jgi:predicted DNA-binding transcriptional regulator AlpA